MLSAPEQFFLEQLNRARLNPLGEATRFGIGLNDPDPTSGTGQSPAQTLAEGVRQPLAANDSLSAASAIHSQAYLDGLVQMTGPNAGHHWLDGTTPADRASDAGYGSQFVGENLAFSATTRDYSAEQALLRGPSGIGHHQGLFYSITHRPNILNADYKEAGLAQVVTQDYVSGGIRFNASVITNKFGTEEWSDRFLTGVTYDDLDGDGFYSMGEGRSGVTITALGHSTTAAGAGGYALNLGAQADPVEIAINWQGQILRAAVDLSASNVKLDIVGGSRILASGNLTLLDGVAEGGLLGAGNLALTGNALDNLLLVGRGDNLINGAGGVNTALFTGAFSDYEITINAGTITVSDQRGSALGDGVNTLQNIDLLQFADGVYTPGGVLAAPVAQGYLTLNDPAIGAYMSARERGQDLALTGSSQDLPNGTPIIVMLNDTSYETRTESGQWSVTIRAVDLVDLMNNTQYQITATAQTAAGPVQTSFDFTTTFDAPTLGTYPAPFTGTLGASNLQNGVTYAGVSSAEGGTVTITLAGVAHTAQVQDGNWAVHFPGSTLALLQQGATYQLPLQLRDQFDNTYNFQLSGFTADLDFPPPGLTLNPLPFEGPMTADIRDAELFLSGSSTHVPDSVSVTVLLNDQSFLANVEGGNWELSIPQGMLQDLPDSATLTLSAEVTVSGNTASAATSFQTDFAPPAPEPEPEPEPNTYQLDLVLQNTDGDPLTSGTQARVSLTPGGTALAAQSVDATGAVRFNLPEGAQGSLHVTRDYQHGTDPTITALDALNVLRIAVGVSPSFGAVSAQHFIAADINADGRVTALDALEVLHAAVGVQSLNAPRWVYFDAETDFAAMNLDRTNSFVESGIDLATLNTDQPLAMTGILLGHLEYIG